MHKRTLLIVVMALAFFAGGCVSGTQQSSENGTRKKKGPNDPVVIGFSMDTVKEERWQRDKDLVEKRAKELGMQISVQVANGDDNLQVKQAENLLTQGVDVLIVAPHNGEIAASIVRSEER